MMMTVHRKNFKIKDKFRIQIFQEKYKIIKFKNKIM